MFDESKQEGIVDRAGRFIFEVRRDKKNRVEKRKQSYGFALPFHGLSRYGLTEKHDRSMMSVAELKAS